MNHTHKPNDEYLHFGQIKKHQYYGRSKESN